MYLGERFTSLNPQRQTSPRGLWAGALAHQNQDNAISITQLQLDEQ